MAGENILPYRVASHRHTPEIEEQLALLRASELPVQFQAHLVPLDQGELASCYVTPTRTRRPSELGELYADAYATSRSWRSLDRPPGTREVLRDQLLPRVRRRRRAHRQGGRAVGDRQPLEGHLLAGRPEPEPDVRARTRRRAAVSAGADVWGDRASAGPPRPFFGSRWTPLPEHVRELDPTTAGLPAGFRAAGVACGIKPSGNPDLGIVVCDSETPVSAARFTATAHPGRARAAQPGALSPGRRCAPCSPTPGCANAATGQRGLDDAAKTQGAAAIALGVQPEEVVLGSTGGISWTAGRSGAQGDPRRELTAAPRGRHGLPAGDPDDRCVREARQPGGRAAVGYRPPQRPVQGRGHDLAELRHDALLRADRRRSSSPIRPTCCWGSASSARSTAARSTASSPPTTPPS